ncbi:MAG: nucleotide exchange factor GrpE [Phycisphaerales bacterium]|nr:MAG: nucleotide exchange factor GrpE [Phycisphaerales bacterium]
MPSKTKTTGRKTAPAKKTAKPKAAKKTGKKNSKGKASKVRTPQRRAKVKPLTKQGRHPAGKGRKKQAAPKGAGARTKTRVAGAAGPSPVDVLSRAEADINAAIESLNNQMNAAVSTLTELVASHGEQQAPVMHTAPMDRVTAVFQRLVGEVVDEQLSEILPTLVSLRSEMAGYLAADRPPADADFLQRGRDMLDQVLAGAGVREFDARPGQTYDPLIHLAVGETRRDDLEDAVVGEWVSPGYRTARGKVLVPARVKVNRK